LNTPADFYEEFSKNLPKVDSYCSTLFSPEVIGTKVYLKEAPYPASILLYLSLRWAEEKAKSKNDKFTVTQLNKAFRAFFWSNAFSGRYDQGFLTLFASDLKDLRGMLGDAASLQDEVWRKHCDASLEKILGLQHKRRTKDDLFNQLMEGELRGAVKQAFSLYLFGIVTIDLTDGAPLDRFAEDQMERVQLHHIYPKDWCKNNQADHEILRTSDGIVNAFANLVPLKAGSNNRWKTKSPSTALQDFGLSFSTHSHQLKQAFIDDECFEILQRDKPDPAAFWKRRASLIAEQLYALQFV
jgi:hypothetical protein